jgi:hypothetical protein
MSHLTCIIVAGRRLASLGVCLRWPPLWLPVWLPPDSLNREAESHQRRVIGLHIYIPADSVFRGDFIGSHPRLKPDRRALTIHKLKNALLIVDIRSAPGLLPILCSALSTAGSAWPGRSRPPFTSAPGRCQMPSGVAMGRAGVSRSGHRCGPELGQFSAYLSTCGCGQARRGGRAWDLRQ